MKHILGVVAAIAVTLMIAAELIAIHANEQKFGINLEAQQNNLDFVTNLVTEDHTSLMSLKAESKPDSKPEQFGSVNAVAGIRYYLYGSGVGTTDTSVTFTSFKQPVSSYKLAMADFGDIGYITLEPGNATRQEFVSFTGVVQNADGTATITGVTRGLGFVSPYTASSSLRKSHGGGSDAVISNPPQFYERFAVRQNDLQITGIWGFDTLPTSSVACSSGVQFCNKDYIDAGFSAGGATSTFSRIGFVQLATDKQMASSSASSTAGAPLVLLSKFATTTPGIQCTNGIWNCVPVGNSAGKIDQAWLNLTQSFSWAGVHVFNASSTMNATTTIAASSTVGNPLILNLIKYAFPAVQGASSTILTNDGNGRLLWMAGNYATKAYYSAPDATTGNTSTTTLATVNLPANTITTGKMLRVTMQNTYIGQNNDKCYYGIGIGTGLATTTIAFGVAGGTIGWQMLNQTIGTISATSTNSGIAQFVSNNMRLPNSSQTADFTDYEFGAFIPRDFSTQLYLELDAAVSTGGSATCHLNSALVESI